MMDSLFPVLTMAWQLSRVQNGKTILVRNHELIIGPQEAQSFAHDKRLREVNPEKIYDSGKGTKPGLGGTTTLVYDTKTATLESHYMSFNGHD